MKNFENRLSFGKVTAKNRVVPFFSGHGVVTGNQMHFDTGCHNESKCLQVSCTRLLN